MPATLSQIEGRRRLGGMNAFGLAAHILFGTLAFGMAIAYDLLLVAVARSRSIETIRVTYQAAGRYMPLIGVSFLLAILLGFGIAGARHEALSSRWLVISYGWLVVAGGASGVLIQRRTRRILAAVERAGDGITPELQGLLTSTRPIGAGVMLIAMFAIIAMMVGKPV